MYIDNLARRETAGVHFILGQGFAALGTGSVIGADNL